jgi:hypothetical protein
MGNMANEGADGELLNRVMTVYEILLLNAYKGTY